MVLQPISLDPVQQSIIDWLEKKAAERSENYGIYQRYYGGDHEVKLTDRLKKLIPSGLEYRATAKALAGKIIIQMKRIGSF